MERMEAEAEELGADGIVAMRLTVSVHAWGTNIIEFLALGTAVKSLAAPGQYRTHDGPTVYPAICPAKTFGPSSTPVTARSAS